MDTGTDGLSRAFSTVAAKLYVVDWAAGAREAGRFFLDVLKQTQTEKA